MKSDNVDNPMSIKVLKFQCSSEYVNFTIFLLLMNTDSDLSCSQMSKFKTTVSPKVFADDKLTHYHTMLHFDALKIYSHGKHWEKRRNCLLQAISPFLTMLSTLYGTSFSL